MSETLPLTCDSKTGTTYFFYSQVAILNDQDIAFMQKTLEAASPAVAHRSMYDAGYEAGFRTVDANRSRFFTNMSEDIPFALHTFLESTSRRGQGHFSFGEPFDPITGEGRLHVQNSFIARHYPPQGIEPVCFYTAGRLAGALSALYRSEFYAHEENCLAAKAPACIFSLQRTHGQTSDTIMRRETVHKSAFQNTTAPK